MINETIEQIEARLIAVLQSNTALYDPGNPDPTKRGLTSPSQVSAWRNMLNVFATEIKLLQENINIQENIIETAIAAAIPNTAAYIQKMVFAFQYDSVVPQIAELIDFIPQYPIINDALKPITQVSVKTDNNLVVNIKVAKGGATPVPLSNLELTALDSYTNLFLPEGLAKNLVSLDADKLYINANVYFNGQYAAVIQQSVIDALNNYLATLSIQDNFDGVVYISKLEDTIQAVPGVTDVVINQVKARPDLTPFAAATIVVQKWQTYAGYIQQETTTGETFADTLTFTVMN